MKQILQDLKDGHTLVADVPCPRVGTGQLLIRSTRSLISAGTERMLVDFGKANPIEKARQQPDKVRMVIDKVKTDGLMPTIDAVRTKLEQPLPLGYCNVGVVVEAGAGLAGFAAGDRIASNGKHAQMVAVPSNLCAKVPDSVSDDAAAFTVVGAIALQGIRLVQPTLGETVVVTGLGLIGLMAVQLLRAHGCRVLGIDFDVRKLELARQFGAETVELSTGQDPISIAQTFSRGRGVDAVIITASTKSSKPVHQAAMMCRKRGRIVLVGVTGLELSRADFYEKELSFQVSCSYGPGRYDPEYEEKGCDYPIGFVRWTEQRNFEAILDMMADGRLDVMPLISHRFRLDDTEQAYEIVGGAEPSLGILLDYPAEDEKPLAELTKHTIKLNPLSKHQSAVDRPRLGFIGSGNYATSILTPAFAKTSAQLKSVASSGGVSGVHVGEKFGFEETTTDSAGLINNPEIDAIIITTRHDSHATLVCDALRADKHVFVEKPLALNREHLSMIHELYESTSQQGQAPILMVGFNRRFSPLVIKAKSLLESISEPKSLIMTVNAGEIPSDHWTQDPKIGGGRIIGEACHFIDLLRFLAGSPICNINAVKIGGNHRVKDDKATITLTFKDGSFGSINYLANGHKSFPKERLEIFGGGRILQIDNFRVLNGFGWPSFKKLKLWRQNKGNSACAQAFVAALKNGQASPIPYEELLEVSMATFDVADLLR